MTDFHDPHDGRHTACLACDNAARMAAYADCARILTESATVQQAADALGVSRSAAESLARRLRRAGWPIPERRGGRPRKVDRCAT